MWILRFLSGPLAGQTFPLQKDATLIGRSPSCDIKIPSPGVSKQHTRIEIFDDKVIVTDQASRNGTFLNGVQIRSQKAKSGDRISLHDIVAEVQQASDQAQMWGSAMAPWPTVPTANGGGYAYNGAAAYQMPPPNSAAGAELGMSAHEAGQPLPPMGGTGHIGYWFEKIQSYIDREVLPGVYKLPEWMEFKWVLAILMGVFIMLVTSLSTIPLIRILKVSIEQESQQHALTIATTLARVNRPALMQGADSAVNVDIALSRPGVQKALIISNVDGSVIAPAAQAGTYPDLPFIHTARKFNKQAVKQIDDNTVAAMVPIDFYSADTGTQHVTAFAVVFYDMSSLAVDNAQVLSLFITTLFIALLVGSLLFYFLYKMVEYPFKSLNQQLDTALKEGHDSLHIDYQFPALQTLTSNIGSALNRAINGSQENLAQQQIEHDRNREIANLVELIGFAAMGIHAHDLSIAAVNQAFESRTGMSATQLGAFTVNEINDQALKLSIKDLIERVDQTPDDIATNDLEFSGHNFQVVAQAVFGSSKISYYVIVLLPTEEGE